MALTRDRTCPERSKAIARTGLSYLERGELCFQYLWKWDETSEEARRDTGKQSAKGMSGQWWFSPAQEQLT